MNRIEVNPGAVVEFEGRRYLVTHRLDLEQVLARPEIGGPHQPLRIRDLRQPVNPETGGSDGSEPLSQPQPDLMVIPDEAWREAERRYEIIKPLIENPGKIRQQALMQARTNGVGIATVYRWLSVYQETGRMSALLPMSSPGGRGKSRLNEAVEALIQATIEEYYLTARKPKVTRAAEEVLRRCRLAGIESPHPNTVRNRIKALSLAQTLTRRGKKREAQQRFRALEGSHEAHYPLEIVQIDHTPVDLILVDNLSRLPIGRPWITMAIDVFSRMVLGFYVSLDPPGALSAGLCIARSILPKDQWLAKLEMELSWPCWGRPRTIHLDNAKEFRGRMLQRACEQYGIHIEWRPVATPHYGGHIERLLGTFAGRIHDLPGTTFSNPAERGEYDAEKQAALTLSEFEVWLTNLIVGVYHQEVHSELLVSPLIQYERGVLGSERKPGTGYHPREADEHRLYLDFMPFVERTIQPTGVVVDEIHYFADVLRHWVGAPDPENQNLKRKFIFRRDPRDISRVWFYDPELSLYSEIPYRDITRPPMSLWELRAVMRRLKEEGRAGVDEAAIFETLNRMRAIEEQAVRETKKTRRERQRRENHRAADQPRSSGTSLIKEVPEPEADRPATEILPFEETEIIKL
ncbi:MAG: Mu transposase C-terminal domain-containing protein [Blastocatellia bacterium]|nr:Mu transposase C-terminal domain-containing protein [Blastocatellia bacterium]